ncbi:MAG: HAMP domain-containing protein [Deltaproteobacteria bacterium]|nr:HAMP domain-containing protein [Deltaproteobacteria bacterium]
MTARPARKTVSGRLGASYLVVLGAFALTAGWSLVALRAAARDATTLRSAFVPLLTSIGEALSAQNVLNAQLNHITSAKNPADARQWIETARRLRPLTLQRIRTEAALGLAGDLDRSGLRQHVERESAGIEQALGDHAATFEQLYQALSRGDEAAAERARDQLVARETAAAGRLRGLRQRVDAEMSALTLAAQQRERRSIQLLVALSLITLAVGLVTSVYARRVLRPLSVVTQRARAVARGELTPQPVVATEDEIGELAHAFESMVAAIRQARAELVQAERLATIGKMAAHITHEVRNPLSSIGLNLELLEEELALSGTVPEAAGLVGAIKLEVERLSQIAEQYLAAARRPQPQLARESVEDLLRECHAFLRPELERAGRRSEIRSEPDLPRLDLDEAQMRQALLNLVRNAREASPKGGTIGLLAFALGSAEPGRVRRVAVCVDDEGPGVPEELRASIFDPFFTTKQRGTGLGLAVTRAIVESHGGSVRCEGREPAGSRFRIELPVPAVDQPKK